MVSLSVSIGIIVMIFLLFEFVIAIQTKELSALRKKNIELVDKYEKEIADLNNIIFKLRSDLELSRRRGDRIDYSKKPQRLNGKWIDDCGGVTCSCCGYSIDDNYYAKTYCTNCGAEMEE